MLNFGVRHCAGHEVRLIRHVLKRDSEHSQNTPDSIESAYCFDCDKLAKTVRRRMENYMFDFAVPENIPPIRNAKKSVDFLRVIFLREEKTVLEDAGRVVRLNNLVFIEQNRRWFFHAAARDEVSLFSCPERDWRTAVIENSVNFCH